MAKGLVIHVTTEEIDDRHTGIHVNAEGEATQQDVMNILLTLGRCFHLDSTDWSVLAIAGTLGKSSISGKTVSEEGTEIRIPLQEE